MAFTKIVGAGIHTLSNVHTHNINSSGIITATSFVGPLDGTTGDFSGNVTVDGNLIVNGDTTTLNTTLREVELLRVDAQDNTVTAGIITQRGTGNILDLYDTSSAVFSVRDGGNIIMGASAGSITPHAPLHIRTATTGAITSLLKLHGPFTSNTGSEGTAIDFGTAADTSTGARIIGSREAAGAKGALRFCTGRENDSGFNNGRMVIDETGRIGIGTVSPTALLHLHKASGDIIQKIESSNGASILDLRHTNGYGYINYRQSGAETFRVGQIAQFTSYSVYNPNSSLPYQLCVEGNGEVGINTHNPGDTLHLLRNNANHGIRLQRAGTNPGTALVQVHSNGVLSLQGGNNIHYVSGGSQQHIWYRAGADIGRFDVSGRLLIGLSSDPAESSIVAEGNSNDGTSYAVLDLRRGSAATSSGNVCGYIRFSDTNITNANNNYAWIAGMADGTSSDGNDNPGRLVFATCPDNSNVLLERVRITSGGQIGISPNNGVVPTAGDLATGDSQNAPVVHIKGSGVSATGGEYNLLARFEAGGDADETGAMIVLNHQNDRGLAIQGGRRTGNYAHGALKMIDNVGRLSNAIFMHGGAGQGVNHMGFYTGESTTTTERLHINATGNVGIGTNNPTDILDINSSQASAVSDVYIRNHANLGGVALNLWTQGTYNSPQHKAIIGCTDAGGTIRMGAVTNDPLLLLVNNDPKVTITTGGSVGIGTDTPVATSKLDVIDGIVNLQANSTSVDARVQFTRKSSGANSWIGIPNWDSDGLYIYGPTSNSNEIAAKYTSGEWSFYTNTFGVSNPTPKLHINANGKTTLTTVNEDAFVVNATSTGQYHSARIHLTTAGTAADNMTALVHGNQNAGGSQSYFAIESKNSSGAYVKTMALYEHTNDRWAFMATSGGGERLSISDTLIDMKDTNLHVGLQAATLNFTDSGTSGTKHIEIGAGGGGDALLVTHSSGYGVGYFGYEAGGDRLIIACDNGGGNNKIDFVLDAGTTTGGSTDNIGGIDPVMRIQPDKNIMLLSRSGNNNDTPGIYFRGGNSSQLANFAKIHSRMVSNWGGQLQFKVKNDNGSLSDAYQTAMIMNHNAHVTKPEHPAFFATHTGTDGSTSNGDLIQLTSTRHNKGDCYSTSNYYFTAPVAGVYHFTGQVWAKNGANHARWQFSYYNGSSWSSITQHGWHGNSVNKNDMASCGSITYYMNSGDRMGMRVDHATLSYYRGGGGAAHTYFCGHLVG